MVTGVNNEPTSNNNSHPRSSNLPPPNQRHSDDVIDILLESLYATKSYPAKKLLKRRLHFMDYADFRNYATSEPPKDFDKEMFMECSGNHRPTGSGDGSSDDSSKLLRIHWTNFPTQTGMFKPPPSTTPLDTHSYPALPQRPTFTTLTLTVTGITTLRSKTLINSSLHKL